MPKKLIIQSDRATKTPKQKTLSPRRTRWADPTNELEPGFTNTHCLSSRHWGRAFFTNAVTFNFGWPMCQFCSYENIYVPYECLHSLDVTLFPSLPSLLNVPSYKVAVVAGMQATHGIDNMHFLLPRLTCLSLLLKSI